MHAAAFGNLETMKLLIDKGADVNAANSFSATALLWCARDPEKARLLIDKGADVNAQSKQGRTPLIIAALRHGNAPMVALLLEKGADPKRTSPRGETALLSAGKAGDPETIRLLLAKGANVDAADFMGRTPLFLAAGSRHAEAVRLLITAGADVKVVNRPPTGRVVPLTTNMERNGVPNNFKVTPLHSAAGFGSPDSVRYLLKAGANPNARDSRGLPPLSFAVASETPSAEVVRALIRAGAEVNAADSSGETPLDWAAKFGYPEILAELKQAGAKPALAYQPPKHPDAERPTTTQAVQRSLALLEKTSAQFFQNSGCVACHHQSSIARAQAFARTAGLPVNEALGKTQVQQIRSEWMAAQEDLLQGIVPGGGANRLAENLYGLSAAGHPADTITDSVVVEIAASQEPDGRWPGTDVQHRPPLMQSPFSAAARSIRMLRDYEIPARKQEFSERIARARGWLLQAQPITMQDHATRLTALALAGASRDDLDKAAKSVLALQRADGGWGGNSHMKTDPYATAEALLALAESKTIKVTDAPYRKGIDYLLSTQFPDGSWHVRSRAIKFQPYFESGFPFGHDQWLSTAATAFASQAVALTIQPAAPMSAQTR